MGNCSTSTQTGRLKSGFNWQDTNQMKLLIEAGKTEADALEAFPGIEPASVKGTFKALSKKAEKKVEERYDPKLDEELGPVKGRTPKTFFKG